MPVPVSVLVSVAPLVFRAPEAPAAREARRPHFVRRRASKPARALRSLRCPPHRRCLSFWCARPGPPPTGAAAWPSVFSGALHAGGACGSGVSRPRHRLWAPLPGPAVSPVPSMPAVPVVLVCPARPRHRLRALQPGPPVPPQRRHRGTTSGLECPREARLGLTAAYTHPYGFR